MRRVKLRSELLSKFWGRDMFLGAMVLLPEGWESHPRARYPLVIYHGHFSRDLTGYREAPPDPKLPQPDLESLRRHCPNGHGDQCAKYGYERMVQEAGHRFAELWAGKGFPRVILVEIQHANPYYDDSYAVNSANVGPYGDAITHELDPAPREGVPRPRRVGARHVRRLDRRLGGAGRAGLLPGRVQRRDRQLPRPDRLPRLHDLRHLRRRERLLRRGAVPPHAARRPRATTTAPRAAPWSRTTARSWRSARARAPASSTTSGRRSTRRSGDDGYPRRIYDKRDRRHRPERRRALARELRPRPHPDPRLGARWARSCAASCASTSATMDTYFLDRVGAPRRGAPARRSTTRAPTPSSATARATATAGAATPST